MTMTTTFRRIAADELDHLPADGKRYELIEGKVYVSVAPSRRHQTVAVRLFRVLDSVGRLVGEAYFAPVDVQFTDYNQVQPDLIFIRKERLHLYQGSVMHGAPDIVVEILSPSNRAVDMNEKRALYAAHGVPEYWMTDPNYSRLEFLTLRNGTYEPIEPKDGTLRSVVLPELVVTIADLFADLE